MGISGGSLGRFYCKSQDFRSALRGSGEEVNADEEGKDVEGAGLCINVAWTRSPFTPTNELN